MCGLEYTGLCAVLCLWCTRGGVRAVVSAQCGVVVAVRDVVRACGACVRMLCVSVRCAVRGLLACSHVLGDTRHDADVPLCLMELVASCVSARVCAWCDGCWERGASKSLCA